MSSKTVAQKMYMKDGKDIAFFNEPGNYEELLGGLPDDINITTENADILLAFIDNKKQLKSHLPDLKRRIKNEGALWIAYHKQSSSVDTDINRDSIAALALRNGLKGVAMVSLNTNLSALRLKIIN